ncbi:hypothetical protein EES46_31745 [Streptomyces sp. ADI98-10]|nr:hypothetical protein EES46_31745 [Streptomyces sp. ADI98-10]
MAALVTAVRSEPARLARLGLPRPHRRGGRGAGPECGYSGPWVDHPCIAVLPGDRLPRAVSPWTTLLQIGCRWLRPSPEAPASPGSGRRGALGTGTSPGGVPFRGRRPATPPCQRGDGGRSLPVTLDGARNARKRRPRARAAARGATTGNARQPAREARWRGGPAGDAFGAAPAAFRPSAAGWERSPRGCVDRSPSTAAGAVATGGRGPQWHRAASIGRPAYRGLTRSTDDGSSANHRVANARIWQ